MIYRLLMVFFLWTNSINLFSQQKGKNALLNIEDIQALGLPIMYISTVNSEEPSFDISYRPPGTASNSIKNATKVPGRIIIKKGEEVMFDSDEYEKDKSGMTIKVRGNVSAFDYNGNGKKPYKIKLQKKADLLNRGNDNIYKDKNWVLLKDEKLNCKIGLKINELMGLQWTPQYMYVNVFFNGDYRGPYMLLESVERNEKCRLNVTKDGYIFELDVYWWNEGQYVESDINEYLNYTFKYPDWDEITESELDYFKQLVKNAEESLFNGTYPQYFDVDSFASWMLAHDILGGADYLGSNIFLTKYDNTPESLIKMANMWDFDEIMLTIDDWDGNHYYHYWNLMFNSPNKAFLNSYCEKWAENKQKVFEGIHNYLTDYLGSEECKSYSESVQLNNERWGTDYKEANVSISDALKWFDDRYFWLDNAIKQLQHSTVIEKNKYHIITKENSYNLQGVEVDDGYKGITIRNNKLEIQR